MTLIAKPVNSCRMITERPKLDARPVSSRFPAGVEDKDSAIIGVSETRDASGVPFLPSLFAPLLVADATEKDWLLFRKTPPIMMFVWMSTLLEPTLLVVSEVCSREFIGVFN